MAITEWTEDAAAIFEDALDAMEEALPRKCDIDTSDDDYNLDGLIGHYSVVYGITEDALRHEWKRRDMDGVR